MPLPAVSLVLLLQPVSAVPVQPVLQPVVSAAVLQPVFYLMPDVSVCFCHRHLHSVRDIHE